MSDRPAFASERLIAEPVGPEHAEQMAQVLSDPRIYRFLPEDPPTLANLQRQYAFLAGGKSPDASEHWLTWVVWPRDLAGDGSRPAADARTAAAARPFGFVQATVREPESAHLAYVFAPAHWRKGYARELVAALLDTVFAHYRVARAIVEMDTRNQASIALAHALGFRHVHTVDTVLNGERAREHQYAHTHASWRAARQLQPRAEG